MSYLFPRRASLFINKLRRILAPTLIDAKQYVGTDEGSGELQFNLLVREGCRSYSKVLEVGCGCLNAGIPLIDFLEAGNYVGIYPNIWLRRTAIKSPQVRKLIEEKRARFLSVDDFDASGLGATFDYVLSHSVLSHCAHWQLDQFFFNVGNVLSPHGKVIASIRLAEGNAFGSEGALDKNDSRHQEWQYPGVSWFKQSTVVEVAGRYGFKVQLKPEYTEVYTKTRPGEFHDWIILSRK